MEKDIGMTGKPKQPGTTEPASISDPPPPPEPQPEPPPAPRVHIIDEPIIIQGTGSTAG
jgi:hypothetical protein